MTITCIDLDRTITANPEFFKWVMQGLMGHGQVHVLTGNPQAHHVLAQMGLVKNRDFTHVAVVPEKHIGLHKTAYMKHVGASTLIDNRGKTIKKVRQAGLTGLHYKPGKGS